MQFSGDKRTVIDGPFAEAKEVVAGFTIIQVKRMLQSALGDYSRVKGFCREPIECERYPRRCASETR
jgi:hypothetical protein